MSPQEIHHHFRPIQHQHQRRIFLPNRSLVALLIVMILAFGGTVVTVIALPRIFAEMQYPLQYEDIIVREAQAHDLDPVLVAAVINAESHFNPHATSPVGARGLMQLMPLTSLGLARRMNDITFTIDKLYVPETNIRYGSFHLQGLMGRYNSNVGAALAAYNAGDVAGDRYAAGDRINIPLETQIYVKKVLTAKDQYQNLYPEKLARIKISRDTFAASGNQTIVSKILDIIRFTIVQSLPK